MFFVETQDGKRHIFASEKYARGYLKALYSEHMFVMQDNPQYEIQGAAITENEFRISVKDKSRLYFLGRADDIKNCVYTGRLGRQVKGLLAG